MVEMRNTFVDIFLNLPNIPHTKEHGSKVKKERKKKKKRKERIVC
jgi:hypothetical protein